MSYLEEIKMRSKSMVLMTDPPIYYREVKEEHYKHLIEQAEQNEQRNKKINKVHEYLQEVNAIDQKIEYWGNDVIDVLLSYSKEQAKKSKILERELKNFLRVND